jgi:hypothetical protein
MKKPQLRTLGVTPPNNTSDPIIKDIVNQLFNRLFYLKNPKLSVAFLPVNCIH